MLNTRIVQLLALAVVAASGSLWAKKPTVDESIWIVELEDAPTVQFRGETPQSVAADGRAAAKSHGGDGAFGHRGAQVAHRFAAVRQYVAYLDRKRSELIEQAEIPARSGDRAEIRVPAHP